MLPLTRRLTLSCLALAGAAGCKRNATPPSPDTTSSAAGVAAAPSASAGGAPSAASAAGSGQREAPADEAKKPLTAAERQALARYAAAVGAGRKATRDKRYDDAESAFDRALEQRNGDARALAERGYARLLANKLDAAEQDLERALSAGVEPKLASQAFFNLGLVREKKGEDEPSRAAFAIADALSPSGAAKAKLAGRSACTADLRVDDEDALDFADDFTALAEAIKPAEDLGSPKASVCVQTHTALGTPDMRNACDGPPPWELYHHHLHFTEDVFYVVPAKGRAGLFSFSRRIGAWPAHCTNLPSHAAELAGGLLHVTSTFDGSMAAVDESAPPSEEWQIACVDVLGYEAHTFYDTATGKSRLRIHLPTGVPKPTISVAGSKVKLAGAGCDRVLDLAAPKPRP